MLYYESMKKVFGTIFLWIGSITLLATPPWGWIAFIILGKNKDLLPVKVLGAFVFTLGLFAAVILIGSGMEGCPEGAGGQRCAKLGY